MGINNHFEITMCVKRRGHQDYTRHLLAVDFFDEGGARYSPDEWDCDLPWSKSSLDQYLPSNIVAPDMSIQLDIVCSNSTKHRRIIEKRRNNTRIIVDWADLALPSNTQVILEIREPETQARQIIKISINAGDASIYSHLRLLNETVDWSFDATDQPDAE